VTYVPKGGLQPDAPGNFVKLVATFDIRLADFNVERKGRSFLSRSVARTSVTALTGDASPKRRRPTETAVKYMGKARK
jgi:hypothetical protein